MDKNIELKQEFERLYLQGKYTNTELAEKLSVSRVTIGKWVKECPATVYSNIQRNLLKEVEKLSKNPTGNEPLIFQYIDVLERLDTMIRKAKYLPKLPKSNKNVK